MHPVQSIGYAAAYPAYPLNPPLTRTTKTVDFSKYLTYSWQFTIFFCVFPVSFCVLLFLIAPFVSSFSIFSAADVSALVPFCPAHCYFTHCHFSLLLMS